MLAKLGKEGCGCGRDDKAVYTVTEKSPMTTRKGSEIEELYIETSNAVPPLLP